MNDTVKQVLLEMRSHLKEELAGQINAVVRCQKQLKVAQEGLSELQARLSEIEDFLSESGVAIPDEPLAAVA